MGFPCNRAAEGRATKGQASMVRKTCSECGREIPNDAWSCPHCGNPGEPPTGAQTEKGITPKGMMVMLLLFVLFPILLFLIHIFVPNM